MPQRTKIDRELLSPPGDDIREHIDYIKMTQAELADRLGKTPSKVNDLITGKEPITYDTALQLEKVLGVDAQYWLNREMLYREKLARIEQMEDLAYSEKWVKEHPVKELKKCGYIHKASNGPGLVGELLEYYGVANTNRWESRYVNEFTSAQYRKSTAHKETLASMAAWLRMGEIEMQKLQLPVYDKDLFYQVLQDVKLLVKQHPDNFSFQLKDKCKSAGVAVVYSMCFPKAPVSGATRWFRGNPLIQLTDRHKTNDHFWFTFYHEAAHVMLHGKKEIFLEEFEGYKANKDKEEEANQYAMKWLLPLNALDDLPSNFDDEDIIAIARKHGTHPGIVVGRLQHNKEIGYNQGNHHKIKVSLF